MRLSYEQLIFRNFFQSDKMEHKLTVVFAHLERVPVFIFSFYTLQTFVNEATDWALRSTSIQLAK